MFFHHDSIADRSSGSRNITFVFGVILIMLCAIVLVVFLMCDSQRLQSLLNWVAPKTFWRNDHGEIVKYHIREYRVPWSAQLLAAIAFARKHGEPLYLEDTPPTVYARNRGNVKLVKLSEAELSAVRRVSGFLAEHCMPDIQHADAMTRVFPTDEIAQQAKDLLDYGLHEWQLEPRQHFYLQYLLGVWLREHDSDSANWHFEKAFELADCVVICSVMLLDEHSGEIVSVKNTRFPFGVTTKHRTEQGDEFSLWYPAVETDQHGLICLPVYREMITDPALEAIDAKGARLVVETLGLRDIAKPYRFGMYVPVVLSGEQNSQLTCSPGLEEELRYAKRQVLANLPLDDAATLGELGIVFKTPDQFQVAEGDIIMPTLRYADEFTGLHFRGLTRTKLTRQLRQYRDEHVIPSRGQAPALKLLAVTDGDNFIVSRINGRTYLCRFFASNDPQQASGVLDVWDLGWIRL